MSEKILVADDSPTIQKVVGITLANTEYELEQAQTEEELFEKLKADSFDLVLLDFNLSETSEGYDLAQQIKEESSESAILIMLGTFDSVNDDKLEELGITERVIKPFESTKFIQKIKDVLANREESSSEDQESSSFSESSGMTSEEYQSTGDDGSDDFDTESDDLDDDEWTMSGPSSEDEKESSGDLEDDSDDEEMPEENFIEAGQGNRTQMHSTDGNPLQSEISGWGMSVPDVIGEKDSQVLMPGKIEDEGVKEELTQVTEGEEETFPESEQLEYPDEDFHESVSLESEVDSDDQEDEESHQEGPKSSLISLDELESGDDEDEDDIDDTDPQIVIENNPDSSDLVQSIEDEVSPDEFWAADESYPEDENEGTDLSLDPNEVSIEDLEREDHHDVTSDAKVEADKVENPVIDAFNDLSQRTYDGDSSKEIGPKLEQSSQDEIGPKLERDSQEEIGPKLERTSHDAIDVSAIVSRIKDELKPHIKEMIREVMEEMGKEATERVAWEVIPDLAENLIKDEVQSLSKKVQDKHSLN